MNDQFIDPREAVSYARQALKNGSVKEAREWAELAAQLAPQSEDPWLILAAIVGPREGMAYIRKALQANPNSPRAQKGMQWALQKLGESPRTTASPSLVNKIHTSAVSMPQGSTTGGGPIRNKRESRPKKRSILFPIFLVGMGCAVFLFAAWSAVTSPALASILSIASAPIVQPTPIQSFAHVNIPKPTYTPLSLAQLDIIAPPATLTQIPSILPTEEISVEVIPQVDSATSETIVLPSTTPFIETPSTTASPEITETPGVAYVEIVPDTPTPEYVAPTVAPYVAPQAASYDGEHWIDIDLSQQRVYAYAGDTLVNSFIVSTGTWQTPTVTGKYKVWIKLRSTDMSGPGYYLPDVPYVMYFYKGYGLHGTYWHNNFGTPMSHGCVNLTIPDAEWLYNFSMVGTVVNVHY